MKKLLNRNDILNIRDLTPVEVEVPEWGGSVMVRGLTGSERDKFELSITEQKGKNTVVNLENVRVKLVALTVVDEDGNRIFTDSDITELSKKSATAIVKVFEVAQKLSGLAPEDVERLAENLKNDLKGSSTSN